MHENPEGPEGESELVSVLYAEGLPQQSWQSCTFGLQTNQFSSDYCSHNAQSTWTRASMHAVQISRRCGRERVFGSSKEAPSKPAPPKTAKHWHSTPPTTQHLLHQIGQHHELPAEAHRMMDAVKRPKYVQSARGSFADTRW